SADLGQLPRRCSCWHRVRPRITAPDAFRPFPGHRRGWFVPPSRRTTSRRDDAPVAAPGRVGVSSAGSDGRNGCIRSHRDAPRGTLPTTVAAWCACGAATPHGYERSRAEPWLRSVGWRQHRQETAFAPTPLPTSPPAAASSIPLPETAPGTRALCFD